VHQFRPNNLLLNSTVTCTNDRRGKWVNGCGYVWMYEYNVGGCKFVTCSNRFYILYEVCNVIMCVYLYVELCKFNFTEQE
jgi:hypothetical protein